MIPLLWLILAMPASPFKSKRQLEAENVALQHQVVVLFAYAAYYNQTRPHRSLQKDAPLRRAIQRIGGIAVVPILGGLHHQYVRI